MKYSQSEIEEKITRVELTSPLGTTVKVFDLEKFIVFLSEVLEKKEELQYKLPGEKEIFDDLAKLTIRKDNQGFSNHPGFSIPDNCDCNCHTAESSSEDMRRTGCDLCYSESEYNPRHPKTTSMPENWEKKLKSIAIDMWANINTSLKKDGVKYKGDGIGTVYGGWTAMNEIFYPRITELIQKTLQEERDSIIEWIDNSELDGEDIGAIIDYIKGK